MGWIRPADKMPPEGLQVLIELSGRVITKHGNIQSDHAFHIGTWIVPTGEKEGHWLVDGRPAEDQYFSPTIHAWMPLPKHFEPQGIFSQEEDLMEHALFEDDPDWLYKGDCVYESDTTLPAKLEKLSRFEDICDDPDKLLLCCNLKALEALKNDSADTTGDTVGDDLDSGAEG